MPVYQITLSLQTINGFCFLWVFTFASRSCLDKILRLYVSVFFFVLVLNENVYQTLETVFCYSCKHLEVRQKYSSTRRIFNSVCLEMLPNSIFSLWYITWIVNLSVNNSRFAAALSCNKRKLAHFRVHQGLSIKARPGARPFIWKWVWFASEWNLIFIWKDDH